MDPSHHVPPHRVSQDVAWVIELAHRAASHLPSSGQGIAFQSKGAFDVVTAADTEVEAFLCRELRNRFPEDQILAEESLDEAPATLSGRCWVIDPLDGTVNFLSGLPFWAISIALLNDGVPILGVVFDPTRNEVFYAEKGRGAYLDGRPLGGGPPLGKTRADFHRALGGSSGCLKRWSTQPHILADLLGRYGKLRILGSQALHLCYVAAGRFEAAMSVEARLWDDAAAALVVMESGFKYTDFEGTPRFPVVANSPWLRGEAGDSLAAEATIHSEILNIFRQPDTTQN